MTKGQRKFLETVGRNESGSFHSKVTRPLFDAGLVAARPGALFPFIVGCNGQNASDYCLTEAGTAALSANAA